VALFTVVAALAVLSAPSSLLAKGATVRVVITGPDIPQSIKIAEASTLTAFNVWTGPGTSSNEDVGFIVQWSQTVAPPPATVVRYQLSFYTEEKVDQPSYVVFYSYDASTKLGYVYLPDAGEKGYALNIGSIWRGVEGHWFRARDDWNATALRFIFPLSDSSLRPFSTCDAHEFPAHLTTTDPAYSDALTLERELTANGVTVQCIAGSKMKSFFQGQKGAAWFHTAYGNVSARPERRRTGGAIPPCRANRKWMTCLSLPSARPIAFNDCPAFQRLHISARWAEDSFHRLCIMNTTF
jgi:hypothetical protein